jgi:apocytochrome f
MNMKFNGFHKFSYQTKLITYIMLGICVFSVNLSTKLQAFPVYAQQTYENPREATGRIVCANCHLAQKPVEIETPQSILPNTVFEAIVKIPYNNQVKQILGNGNTGNLNVGAIVILPKGFKLAPPNMLSNTLKEKTKGIYIQPYATLQDNILVVGPIPGDKNQAIVFPILSPDPSKDKNIHFFKYPIFVGGNRGRGQIYPTGEKSNNNIISSLYNGTITQIKQLDKGSYEIEIQRSNDTVTQIIPPGLELQIKQGDKIVLDQALTEDPNVGGFGQNETEIVLQSPQRIQAMILFFIMITVAQIFFVLKKKQWEKVQAAEINF